MSVVLWRAALRAPMKKRLPTQKTTGAVRKKRTISSGWCGIPIEEGEPVLHRSHEDEGGEDDPDPEADLEVLQLPLPGGGDRIFPRVVGNPQKLVALIFNRLPERLQAGPLGPVVDRRPGRRQIDRNPGHAGKLGKRPLHAADTGGAGHSPDGNRRLQLRVSRQRQTPLSLSAPG